MEWVKVMGVLPFRSTNRTETWHRLSKASYRASNKGPQAVEYILRDEARSCSLIAWERGLPLEGIHVANRSER